MKRTKSGLFLTTILVIASAGSIGAIGSISAAVVLDETKLRRWISEDKRDAIEGLGPRGNASSCQDLPSR